MAYRSDWQGQRFSTSPNQRAQLARQLSSAFSSALVGGVPRSSSQRGFLGSDAPASLASRIRDLFGRGANQHPSAGGASANNPITEWGGGASAPLRDGAAATGDDKDLPSYVPPPPAPSGGRGMLSLYRSLSMEAGRSAPDRDYKALYMQRLRDQRAQRLALREQLKARRARVSAIKCSTFFAPLVDMIMNIFGPIWMLFGVITTLFLVAAKLEGQLPFGDGGWWIVGGPTIFATGALFLNVFVAVCIECFDPEGTHSGILATALCRCCSGWCQAACGECHTITRDSPAGAVVNGIASSGDNGRGETSCGLPHVGKKAFSSHVVLLLVPLLSCVGTVLVTAKLAGATSISHSAALVPWMIASFQAFAIVGIEIGTLDDSEDTAAVVMAFFASAMQFTTWLLIGLYADGSLSDGSACLAGIPYFIIMGCGSLAMIAATCAAAYQELSELVERSVPMAVCACLCAVPCVFIPAAAMFSPFVMPVVQVCLTFDNDMDPSKAGIAGQDNWYQVLAGWLFLLLVMCPALGGAASLVASEGNAFRESGWIPCISTMCWRNLRQTDRGAALLRLSAGLEDEGE